MEQNQPTRDVERAISGDSQALERLWEQHRRWSAAILLAHKPADAELDDLLQDIAMTLVRKIHELRDPALFKPWLRRLTINTAITAGRRRKTRLRLVKPMSNPDAIDQVEARTADHNAAHEEGRRLLDLAQRLHPDYREPLLLKCVRGMRYKQIADVLGLPVTTVETRITRARRMLREEVEFEEEAATMRITRRAGGCVS